MVVAATVRVVVVVGAVAAANMTVLVTKDAMSDVTGSC